MTADPHDDEKHDEAIRAAGMRVTRQRRAIMQALEGAEDHPDAPEIHRRAQESDPSVSIATVYRTLSALADAGMVQRHAFSGATTRFETADTPHHDHIVDVETGEVIEFMSAEIERLQREVARRYGYEIVSHRLELYCRKKR